MGDLKVKLKLRTHGREMMRVQGVYMYIINGGGQLGAIMGFFPMVIVMYEDTADMDPIRGYLRVDRWVYPLARSFSPIYIWGPDRMIMPEPFSTVTEPVYVVIRIPFGMSRYQKDTLWNLLDINAHVCGKFADFTEEQMLKMDKLFALTEITPRESHLLNVAGEGVCPPGTKDLPSLRLHTMKHKLLSFERNEGKLSVCFAASRYKKAFLKELYKDLDKKPDDKAKCPPPSYQQAMRESVGSTVSNAMEKSPEQPGNHPSLVYLPSVRGNLMRLYILGPRDRQHIRISTAMEWIPIIELMLKAVQESFREQVRLRKEKEEQGIPPSFEGRRKRLVGGWGGADALNAFGIARPTEETVGGTFMNLVKNDPAHKSIFQSALKLQNLESAAAIFDHAIDHCNLELLAYSPTAANADRTSPTRWLGALIPRPLIVRYRRMETPFVNLMTLSAAIDGDIVYERHTNYLERIHEDCEHHYPKLRPRNPLLDPRFPYPREPTAYTTK